MSMFRAAMFLVAALSVPAVVAPSVWGQTMATPAKPAPAAVPGAKPMPPAAVPAASPSAARIDVNSASAEQLDTIPGVGDARAKLIIANRPYATVQDLVTKKALPKSVLDGAKGRIALANVNTTSAKDLATTLPGIGDVRAKAIVDGRPYASPQDLVTKNILTPALFDKIKDLVTG